VASSKYCLNESTADRVPIKKWTFNSFLQNDCNSFMMLLKLPVFLVLSTCIHSHLKYTGWNASSLLWHENVFPSQTSCVYSGIQVWSSGFGVQNFPLPCSNFFSAFITASLTKFVRPCCGWFLRRCSSNIYYFTWLSCWPCANPLICKPCVSVTEFALDWICHNKISLYYKVIF